MNSEFIIALHALAYLRHRNTKVSSEELAKSICTNPARIRKVMAKLKKAGLLETREGNSGGYELQGDASTIKLSDHCTGVTAAIDEIRLEKRCD